MSGAPAFLGVEQSVSGRRWRARLDNERAAAAISQRLGLPEVVGRVIAARGVGIDQAADYLEPTLKRSLPDPSSFIDMDRAATRVARAIRDGEQVAVFGDYDVDGATSSALLKRYFKALGVRLRVHIPDRLKEGYGPNTRALLGLREAGVGLVITVDCGTMAFEPLAAATAAGLDIIVIDHHQAGPELPDCLALVNPNRLDDTSGHGQLAAVGVTFLLVVAVNRVLRGEGRPVPNPLGWLDLVALGTICDVVPLTGVNRALVRQGLKVMAGRKNAGIAALCDIGRLSEAPGTYHAGFILGPRVNAGGRVGSSDLGVRLLTTDDGGEAHKLAQTLDALNAERKDIEAAVQDMARDLAAAQCGADGTPPPVICVAAEDWHPGVIGIVASRLKDKFGRPVMVIAIERGQGKGEGQGEGQGEGIGRGSGRSLVGVDLGAAVTAAGQAGLLINGGGHAMAAGLTVEAGKIEALRDFLCDRLGDAVERAAGQASLGVDGVLTARGANVELADTLATVGPFGAGNPEPRFALAQMSVVRADIVGTNHVRCVLAGRDGGRVSAIAFRVAAEPLGALLLARRTALHVAGHLRADNWRGKRRVQFTIDDAAPC